MIKKLLYYAVCWLFFTFTIRKISGIEHIPEGGFVVAANHTSYNDIILMSAALLMKKKRPLRFIAKDRLLRDKAVIGAQKCMEYKGNKIIFVNQEKPSQETFDEAYTALANNDIIGIYPEGTRSKEGKMLKGKTGMVRIAVKAKVPLVPLGIVGSKIIVKKKALFPLREQAVLSFGKPVTFEEYYDKNVDKETLEKLTRDVMCRIAELSGQRYEH